MSTSTTPATTTAATTTAATTTAPATTGSSIVCQPNVGECVSTATQLESVVATIETDHVIALCSDANILLPQSLTITQDGVTFCGQGLTQSAQIQLADNVQLRVTGANFSFFNLAIQGTPEDSLIFAGGRRILIQAPGSHLIVDCTFVNTRQGPTITTTPPAGRVTIRNSTFADMSSWGLQVLDTLQVLIEDSTFRGNRDYGLYTGDQGLTNLPAVEIRNSVFQDNFIGYIATTYGSLPSLRLIDNVFDDNDIAASFCCADAYTEFVLSGNRGSSNQGGSQCSDFYSFEFPTSNSCIAIDTDLSLP